MDMGNCDNNCRCERSGHCPVYTRIVEKHPKLLKVYKEMFCECENGMKNCRRWQVFKVFGECPDCVLPNSYISDAEVIKLLGNVAFSSCRIEKFLDVPEDEAG